jgi:hypothetical protein
MAYFTYLSAPRTLTDAESTQVTDYVNAQITAGTTDGNRYGWPILATDPAIVQNVRMWSTSESANGYASIMEGFSPSIAVAVY